MDLKVLAFGQPLQGERAKQVAKLLQNVAENTVIGGYIVPPFEDVDTNAMAIDDLRATAALMAQVLHKKWENIEWEVQICTPDGDPVNTIKTTVDRPLCCV